MNEVTAESLVLAGRLGVVVDLDAVPDGRPSMLQRRIHRLASRAVLAAMVAIGAGRHVRVLATSRVKVFSIRA